MLINLHSPVGCAFLLLCLFLLPYAVSYIYTFQKFCSKNFYNTHYVSANQQMHQRHGFIQKKTHSLGVSSFSQLFMTSSETNSFLMTRHISRLCDTVGGSYADFYYLNFPWDSHSYSTDRVPSMYLLSRYTNPDFGDVVPDVDMGHFFSEILMQGSDGEVLYRQYVVYDEQLIIPVIEDEEIIGLFRVAKKQTNYFSNNVKNEWANDSKQVPLICLNVQILSTLIKSMIKDGNSLQNAEKLELYYHESMTSLQTLRTFAKILRKRCACYYTLWLYFVL